MLHSTIASSNKVLPYPLFLPSLEVNKAVFLRESGFSRLQEIFQYFKEEKPLTYASLALRSLCHIGRMSAKNLKISRE